MTFCAYHYFLYFEDAPRGSGEDEDLDIDINAGALAVKKAT